MMIQNYLKTGWRNMLRHKAITFINIFGLSVGLCACILIFMYVKNELSFDAHHSKSDRIFRITSNVEIGDNFDQLSRSSFALSPMLLQEYPEIEQAIRLINSGRQTFWYGDNAFQYDHFVYTEPAFFSIFDYEFIEGDPVTALDDMYGVVISDEVASHVFGSDRGVVGKHMLFSKRSYKVTGVFRQKRDISHIDVDIFGSVSSLSKEFKQKLNNDWMYMFQSNYLLFKDNTSHLGFEEKLADFSSRHIDPWLEKHDVKGRLTFQLQPLRNIHLDNHLKFDDANVTNKLYIYIFSIVAIIILLIACINYMNLATAKSAKRSKETGIRKTMGASRLQLIFQFLSESLLISLFAIFLALTMVELLLPAFNDLTRKSISFSVFGDVYFLLFILGLLLCTGILAGFYPAFVLSGFRPVSLMKAKTGSSTIDVKVRKALVVVQFSISAILIICTYIVYTQMYFMKNNDIGFDKEQLLVVKVPVADSSFVHRFDEVKNELMLNPSVTLVSGGNVVPGSSTGSLFHYITYQGSRADSWINYIQADYDYLDALGLKIKQGRFFSRDLASDSIAAFVVNEAAVRNFGWDDLEELNLQNALGVNGKIVGVVEDFHYASLHKPIEPLVFLLHRKIPGLLLIKMETQNMSQTMQFVENTWKMFSKRYPMEYYFLDEHFDKQYRAEERMLTIFGFFSVLAIIIASMGLYGLASYSVELRTREIGIRKVMGASSTDIFMLINKDFIPLILLSLIIAFPISWYVMSKWLQDFAYRIGFSVWPFATAGIIAIGIAVITISWQALKVAASNPAESLKYE